MALFRASFVIGLALRAAMFAAGSILTAPATATAHPREAPLVVAQQGEAMTSGGLCPS